MQHVSAYHVPHSRKHKVRNIGSAPILSYPTGFSDGAAANLTKGAGILLLISQSHHFNIKMGCGKSTNTRAEIMVLWALLYFPKKLGSQ